MKRIILLGVILFGTPLVFGQVTYGAKAGLNMSRVKNLHSESTTRYGLQVGGFASIPIDDLDMFYIQPEILYSQQGEGNDKLSSGGNLIGEEKYKLDYISIPILFRAYFSERESDFYGEIGPQFAFLISDKKEADSGLTPSGEEYKTFDFLATVGLGYSLYREYEMGVRFSYGIIDIADKDSGNQSNRNGVFQIFLAYRF